MNIKVIRGTRQIGGSAVEITTKKSRILIDFGAELNDNPKGLKVKGVTYGKSNCDAIFFSHYHGDHIGLINSINKDIDLYIGIDSKVIMKKLARQTKNRSADVSVIERMKTYVAGEKIIINDDISITPYYVDHSAFDSHMFLIEADGKRALYTGDFRTHGFIGKKFFKVIKYLIKKVDYVICEGTTLSRDKVKTKTENVLQREIANVIKDNKYSFVLCGSTNIDRIASICHVVPRGKYCLMDKYQKDIVDYIKERHQKDTSLYNFGKSLYYEGIPDEKMKRRGFVMFVRANGRFKRFLDKYKDAKVVYSMWHGYIERKDEIKKFLEGHEIIEMHTSGHADRESIVKLLDMLSPAKVIPIHTENGKEFEKIVGKERYINADDKKQIRLS